MAREFAKAFYSSAAWKKCRAAYISHRQSVDGGLCEECHDRAGYIVHHKTELTPENIGNPDVTLSFSNLKYVCLDCHNREHGYCAEDIGLVRYCFTADGDIVPLPPEMKDGARGQ